MKNSYGKKRTLGRLKKLPTNNSFSNFEYNLILNNLHVFHKALPDVLTILTKSGIFFGLPKILNSEEIRIIIERPKSACQEIPDPIDLKYRRIVAGSPYRFSKLIDILISTSSSSSHATKMDTPYPLSPLLPIVYRLWQVFRATSRILTELLYVCSSWGP